MVSLVSSLPTSSITLPTLWKEMVIFDKERVLPVFVADILNNFFANR